MDFLLSSAGEGQTPSAKEFIHEKIEQELRFLAWEILRTAASLLKTDIFVATRAMMLFHRLHAHISMRDIDLWDSVLACFMLSLKLEEYQRKISDVVSVFLRLQYRYLDMSATSMRQQVSGPDAQQLPNLGNFKECTAAQQENIVRSAMGELSMDEVVSKITQHERLILKSSGYNCSVGQPHLFLIPLCAIAVGGIDSFRSNVQSNTSEVSTEIAFDHSCFATENVGILDAFIQKAWNYVNDSYETTLCCREKAASIACAAVYLVVCANVKYSPSMNSMDAREGQSVPQTHVIDSLLRASATTAENLANISLEILRIYERRSLPRYFAIDGMHAFKSKLESIEKARRNRPKLPSQHARLQAKLQSHFGRDNKIANGNDNSSGSVEREKSFSEKPRQASDALAMLESMNIPWNTGSSVQKKAKKGHKF